MKEQYRIAAKRSLTPEIGQISVEAPLIAAKAKAGQFIILRVDEAGERIPLTISSALERHCSRYRSGHWPRHR